MATDKALLAVTGQLEAERRDERTPTGVLVWHPYSCLGYDTEFNCDRRDYR